MSSSCPLCGGGSRERLRARDVNRAISDRVFTYRECAVCQTLFLADPPEDLGRYYPPAYYDVAAAVETEQAKLELLHRFARPPGRLVEVGPGAGGFAAAASAAGWAVTGVEMDAGACEHLRSLGVDAVQSDEPHTALARLAPVGAIVLWHVLEHLADPGALLRAAAGALMAGGVLMLAVPNPQAFQLRVLRGRWAHIDAPRHRALIPARALLAHTRAAGFEPLALMSADRAGRDWNVFGWQHALLRPDSGPWRRRAAFYAGALMAAALAPIERHGLRGSTYTLVLRHPGGR